jgi:polysaccharide export outer membrane protein
MQRKKILFFCFLFLFYIQSFSITYSITPDVEGFSPELRKPEKFVERQQRISPLRKIHKATDYILGEEDVIDITVWQDLRPKRVQGDKELEYTINKADVLNISVWQWPDLDKEVIVRPDGKISFPLVGDIKAEGLTLTELDEIITEKLKDFIKSPEVSVMITKFGSVAAGAITTAFPFVKIDDLSMSIAIPPGGKVDFPLIGEVQTAGLTLEQLRQELTQRFSSYIPNPEVNILISSFGGKKIIILGEVVDPGVYTSVGKVSVLEAISLAGGYTRDAVLKNVLVIRGDLSNPEVFVLNLHKVLKNKDMSQNIEIQPRDIIYVPRTVIAEVNYYLKKLLEPLTSSSSAVTAIKTIRTGPSPKK